MSRDIIYDRARGIAILAMVMANSAPIMKEGFQPDLWFRLLSSLPAPTFTIVAGLMIALHAYKRSFGYNLVRGLFIVAIGVMVDLCINQIVPFNGFDILYLIGVSIPLVYLANHLNTKLLSILVAGIFLVTIPLQKMLGYVELPLMVGIGGTNYLPGNDPVIWKHFLIDGWFPLFPWLGFALSGILFKRWHVSNKGDITNRFCDIRFVLFAVSLVAAGTALSIVFPTPHYLRYGYVEWFYPASMGFCLLALGAVGLLIAASEWIRNNPILTVLEGMGSMTLAMYVCHLAIIAYLLHTFFAPVETMRLYWGILIAHYALLIVCSKELLHLRVKYNGMPTIFKWAIGK